MSSHPDHARDLPPVDDRLVMPGTRYEVIDGQLVYVSPADQPHASRHSKLSALLEAYVTEAYDVASDMLTRTSELNDIAPDASVYPAEPHPETGGRQLEELAFQIVSTERLGAAAAKASRLVGRGVRRVIAIDVARRRAFEWSSATSGWTILPRDAVIEDKVFVVSLPVAELVNSVKSDDAVARALLAKANSVLLAALARERTGGKAEGIAAGKAEGIAAGKAEALLTILRARGFAPNPAQEARIASAPDGLELDAWLARAATCSSISDLLEG